jgi:putative transposase
VAEDTVRLYATGMIAQQTWNELPAHYPYVSLDAFVVMPNHVHGVIVLADQLDDSSAAVGAGLRPAPTKSRALPEIVRAFKSFSARSINLCKGLNGSPVWQRNYYEHVIRDEKDLNRIRQYIAGNPARWAEDENNPAVWARCVSRM